MAGPGGCRVPRVLEPGQPAARGLRSGLAILRAVALAVGARHQVGIAIAIDVGQGESDKHLGRHVSDHVTRPRCRRVLRLRQPDHPVATVPQRNVEPTVAVEVGEIEVEPGDAGWQVAAAGDLDTVLIEGDGAIAGVLEPEHPCLAPGPGHHVQVAVTIEVDRLGVDRDDDPRELVLDPPVPIQRIGRQGEVGDRVGLGRATRRVLGPLVRGHDLGPPIAIEVGGPDADERPAVQGDGRDDPLPSRRARVGARVLEVDQVRQLAGHDDVQIPVAVHVGDRHILGGTHLLALTQRRELPHIGVGRPEGDPHVSVGHPVVRGVGLVDRDNVHESVLVEVGNRQPVTAGDGDTAGRLVVDNVFLPGDVSPVGGPRAGQGVGHTQRTCCHRVGGGRGLGVIRAAAARGDQRDKHER